MKKIIQLATNAFPVWIILCSIIALNKPSIFTWFTGQLIPVGLGIIMLGMGLTLKLEDFEKVLHFPGWVILGLILQYTIMPFFGWFLGYVFNLPVYFAVGLILVSCCPGGTASNVISYLARVNVALSVTMTAISTILAIVLTPILSSKLIGNRVEVDALGLFFSTVKVVLLPIIAGVLMNKYLPKITAKLVIVSPLIAVIFIVLIVASIIGSGKDEILHSGISLIFAVLLLHAFGFIFGYLFGLIFIKDEQARRTISIEVGMQNSGLGAVLARENFAHPATAIPSAISSAVHSIYGSILAGYWRFFSKK